MKKRSVVLFGHATSLSLEESFWSALKEIAAIENISMAELIRRIDEKRTTNLSSALRVHVLTFYKNAYNK